MSFLTALTGGCVLYRFLTIVVKAPSVRNAAMKTIEEEPFLTTMFVLSFSYDAIYLTCAALRARRRDGYNDMDHPPPSAASQV